MRALEKSWGVGVGPVPENHPCVDDPEATVNRWERSNHGAV